MKRIIHPIAGAVSLYFALLVAAASHASVIATEGFDYDDGPLAGNNGGSGWAGAWTGNGAIAAGQATDALPAFRPLATPIDPTAGNRFYVSFDFGADGSALDDFAGLSFFDGDTQERLFFGLAFNVDGYGFNVTGFANEGSAVPITLTPRNLLAEVAFLSGDTLVVDVYVDSSPLTSMPVTTYNGAFISGGAWDTIRLSGFSFETGSVVPSVFDNIRIGTELRDVIDVPEPATWLLMLGGLGLMGSRRRN